MCLHEYNVCQMCMSESVTMYEFSCGRGTCIYVLICEWMSIVRVIAWVCVDKCARETDVYFCGCLYVFT